MFLMIVFFPDVFLIGMHSNKLSQIDVIVTNILHQLYLIAVGVCGVINECVRER